MTDDQLDQAMKQVYARAHREARFIYQTVHPDHSEMDFLRRCRKAVGEAISARVTKKPKWIRLI